jgi:hypothetical protein
MNGITLYVIAGNYTQYQDYLRKENLNPTKTRCIMQQNDVRGIDFSNENIVKIGSWYQLKDLEYIREVLAIQGVMLEKIPEGGY